MHVIFDISPLQSATAAAAEIGEANAVLVADIGERDAGDEKVGAWRGRRLRGLRLCCRPSRVELGRQRRRREGLWPRMILRGRGERDTLSQMRATMKARSLSPPNSGLPKFGNSKRRGRIYPTSTGDSVGVKGVSESRFL